MRPGIPLGIGVLLVTAFVIAVLALRGVTWPYDEDHLRDIGSAQAFLEGQFADDPAYPGELRWYPPLVPTLLATTHLLTGLPLPRAHVALGLVLGLLPVVGMTALTWAWFGRVAGFGAAAAAVVLAQGQTGGWLAARYSPWLFSAALVLALSSACLLAIGRAAEARPRPSLGWWSLAGGAAGLAALADVGAALMLAVVAAFEFLRLLRRDGVGRALAAAVVCGVPAAAVAGLHLGPLLIEYGGHIRNPLPGGWRYSYGSVETLVANLNVGLVLSVVGIGRLRSLTGAPARVLKWWIAAATILFVEGYLGARLGWPVPVPDWHYWVQLHAAQVVLAGLGLAVLVSHVPAAWQSEPRVVAVVLLLCVVQSEGYVRQYDLTTAVQQAHARARGEEARLVSWVRDAIPASALVLADHEIAQNLLLPAGRAVVCLNPYFSSPFVDWTARHARHQELELDPSGVDYVVSRGPAPRGGTLVKTEGELRVWRLR